MKTIQTDNYLLLVDETANKTQDTWYYNTKTNQLNRLKYVGENDVKIIAASPKLEGVYEFETLPPAKSETMFSMDDMRKALLEVALWGSVRPDRFEKVEQLIHTLSKEKEWEFVPQMEVVYFHGSGYYKEAELSEDDKEKYALLKTEQPKIEKNKIQGTWRKLK